MKKILVIDGNSILNRAFYGIRLLTNKEGLYTNAIYGMITMVSRHMEAVKPDYCAVAFDLKAPTFRHKMYDGYKGTRHAMPDELAQQMPILKELLTDLGYRQVSAKGWEADDILGTLAAACAARQDDCFLASGDRDSLQLVSDVPVNLSGAKVYIPVEVQIRTERMDAVAERGSAAHWRYKGVNQVAQTSEMWLGHLRELIEDTTHSLAQRFDAKPASGEIFVFTPNGDLRKLPEGATLLDFAFDIHTSLGSTCVGGRVNGRAVPIREQLRNGDIVELTTQKNQTPKSDWLSLVVTSKARNKIKSYLREEQAKHTRMGREELERKLKNWKFAITIDEAVAYLAKYFKLRLGTEVYALIATQKLDFGSIKEILSRPLSGEAEEERRAAAAALERQKAALHGTQEMAAPQDALVIDDDISKIQYKLA